MLFRRRSLSQSYQFGIDRVWYLLESYKGTIRVAFKGMFDGILLDIFFLLGTNDAVNCAWKKVCLSRHLLDSTKGGGVGG